MFYKVLQNNKTQVKRICQNTHNFKIYIEEILIIHFISSSKQIKANARRVISNAGGTVECPSGNSL